MPGATANGIRAGRAYVEIGGEASGLRKTLDQASGMLKGWGRKLAGIGAGFAAAGGLLSGVVLETTNEFRAMSREMASAQEVTGVGVETLGALGYAAQQCGGSLNDIVHGLPHFARFLNQVEIGSADAMHTLELLGMRAEDMSGTLVDSFLKVSTAISNLRGSKRLQATMGVFSRHGVMSAGVLAAGGDTLRALMEQGQRQGLVMTEEEVTAGHNLNRVWNQMTQSVRMLSVQVGAGLLPQWLWLIHATLGATRIALQWVRAVREWIPWLDRIATLATLAGGAIIGLGATLGVLGFALRGFVPLFNGLVGTWRAAIGAGSALVGTLVSVGRATASTALATLNLAGAVGGPVVRAFMALAGVALAPVRAALGALASAALVLGQAVLSAALLPVTLLVGGLVLLAGAAWSVATAIAGAAAAVVVAVVGGIGSALTFMAGAALAPFSSMAALIGSMYAYVVSVVAGASATGVLGGAMTALGASEGTAAAITGFLATATAVLTPVVTAAAAAYAAGSSASLVFAAALTGLGLSQVEATALTTILTTALAMYSGTVAFGAGVSAILTAALVGLGVSQSMAATITSYLAAAWVGMIALFTTATGSVTLLSIATGLLTLAKMGLSGAVSIATGVYGLFSAALLWTAAQTMNLVAWVGSLSIAQGLLAIVTPLVSGLMGLLGFVIGGVATETVIAEAVTGAWVIALGLLAVAGAGVVAVLGLMALALGGLLVLAGAAAAALVAPVIIAGALIYAFWHKISSAASTAWDWIVAKTTRAVRAIGDWVAAAWGATAAGAASAWHSIADTIGEIAGSIAARVRALTEGMGEAFATVFASIGAGNIEDALAVGWATIQLGWVRLTNFLQETWLSWRNWFLDTAEGAWVSLRELWHSGAFSLRNIWQLLGEAVSASWSAVTAFLRAQWARLVDFITGTETAAAIEGEAGEARDAAARAGTALGASFDAAAARGEYEANVARRSAELEAARGRGGEAERRARGELDFAQAQADTANILAEMERAGQMQSWPNFDQHGEVTGQGMGVMGTFSGAAVAGLVGAGSVAERQLEQNEITNAQLAAILAAVTGFNLGLG
jgi:hypothetical protein